ncbi:hypothetical protein PoB_003466600 [Plakobranchus ocellatus]|uniref:Uncharacterized protein n=1 Tax=Plakobranchus ocellatus TaxID=259542 RepID=A0AAV4ANK6_9GAST|nr:hypothetical protein PoB_003466600 [Plakobranchus ocellatus]
MVAVHGSGWVCGRSDIDNDNDSDSNDTSDSDDDGFGSGDRGDNVPLDYVKGNYVLHRPAVQKASLVMFRRVGGTVNSEPALRSPRSDSLTGLCFNAISLV